jgi:hypothetical protein
MKHQMGKIEVQIFCVFSFLDHIFLDAITVKLDGQRLATQVARVNQIKEMPL